MKKLLTLALIALLASCGQKSHTIQVENLIEGVETVETTEDLKPGQEVWITWDANGDKIAKSESGNSIGHLSTVK